MELGFFILGKLMWNLLSNPLLSFYFQSAGLWLQPPSVQLLVTITNMSLLFTKTQMIDWTKQAVISCLFAQESILLHTFCLIWIVVPGKRSLEQVVVKRSRDCDAISSAVRSGSLKKETQGSRRCSLVFQNAHITLGSLWRTGVFHAYKRTQRI